MSDDLTDKPFHIRERLEKLLGADLTKPIEVTPHDKWDYFEVANDPEIGAPRAFRRGCFVDFQIEAGDAEMSSRVSFVVPTSEWRPWPEAVEELKALMATWRARGWDAAAEEVEDGVDYEMMGETVTVRVPRNFPLSECRFYRDPPINSIISAESALISSMFNRMVMGEVNGRGSRFYYVVDENAPGARIFWAEDPRDSGIPYVMDDSIPANEIHMRERCSGKTLAKLVGLAEARKDVADYRYGPTTPTCAPTNLCPHCQRSSTELSYSLCLECVNCHSWFDGAGYVFEDNPSRPCAHLNQAQRRFILNVGTRTAYADGGKRLAELADVVEENAHITGIPAKVDISFDDAPTWKCFNHPAGLEITYPATTPKCEVCELPRPEPKPEKCYQCSETKVFSGEFCDDCTEANREEGPEVLY